MSEALLSQTALDVILHPVTRIEAFGMAIVEEMALGKGVVANHRNCLAKISYNAANGILLKSRETSLLGFHLHEALFTLAAPHHGKALLLPLRSFNRCFHATVRSYYGNVRHLPKSVDPSEDASQTFTAD